MMLSPYWLFALPAMMLGTFSLALLAIMAANALAGVEATRFGNYWAILAGSTITLSHVATILALAGKFYGIREKYRSAPKWLEALSPWLTLETMLILGLVCIGAGFSILAGVVVHWSAHDLAPIASVLPAVLGTCALAIGMQNILGGFLLAIVSGNNADFVQARTHSPSAEVAETAMPAPKADELPTLRRTAATR
jgi:hypothetical protein